MKYDKHRHILKPCPGCGTPIRMCSRLCWGCYSEQKRHGTLPNPGYVIVDCNGCGEGFVTKKDWDQGPRTGRGMPWEKPTAFYCATVCAPWGRRE